MKFTRNLSELDKDDVSLAGGKGASLGEMIKAGIPVPGGFVVLSTAFEDFIEKTDLNVEIDSILHSVDLKKMHTIEEASEKINALILNAKIPNEIVREIKELFKKMGASFVAVRSSATAEDSSTAAWAGQLETYLNTTEENLIENIKKCWASLFTPRAIFYRFEKDLHKQRISVAVVVQKMIQSDVSGIAFSVHPVTEDRNQLIIEAGYGLGEAIVSGSITPDSYVAEKEPLKILDKNVYAQEKSLVKSEEGGTEWKEVAQADVEKQKLTDNQVLELTKIIINIEDHYGFPVDVEWALENGKFYLTQSRPITTLSADTGSKEKFSGVPDIANDDLQYLLERNELYFVSSILAGGFCGEENVKKIFDISPPAGIVQRNDDFFLIKSTLIPFTKKLKEKIKQEGYVRRIIEECHQAGAQLQAELKEIGERAAKVRTKEEIARLLEEFFEKAKTYCSFYPIALFEKPMTEFAEKIAKKYTKDDNEMQEIFNLITTPSHTTEADKERDDFLKLCALADKGEDISHLAEEHARKYGWIAIRYLRGNLWKKEDILKRVAEADLTLAEQELKSRKKHRKGVEEKLQEFIKKVSNEDKERIQQIREIVYLRTQRAEYLDMSTQYIIGFLHRVNDELGLDYEDMLQCNLREIVDMLTTGINLKEEIAARHKELLVFHNAGGVCLSGEDAEEYMELLD